MQYIQEIYQFVKIIKTKFKGLIILKRPTYFDNRGFLKELFEQKKFQIALEELLKVPVHSPDYEKSQRYISLINYNLLLEKYTKSSSKERFFLIKDLVKITNELNDSELLLENIKLIKNELKIKATKKKTKFLINMLWSIVEISDDKNLYAKTLNYLLKDFETYYAEPEVRTLVFQIIGNLKIQLM